MADGLTWDEQTRMPLPGPLTCRCCGRQGSFATPQQAHSAGWDVWPYFDLSPICSRCLSSLYLHGTCRHTHGGST